MPSSVVFNQIYGAEAPAGGDVATAVDPGAGESASNFDIAEYAVPDRSPALVLVLIVAAFVGLRVLWDKAE